MLISIEPDGPVPIYQQIRDRIVEAIARREAPAGTPLPSTRQLALDLTVNVHTVNKSYEALRREGLVQLGRRSGAVIRRDARSGAPDAAYVEEWTGRLLTLLAEAAAQGLTAERLLERCRGVVETFAGAAPAPRIEIEVVP